MGSSNFKKHLHSKLSRKISASSLSENYVSSDGDNRKSTLAHKLTPNAIE